MTVLLAVGIVGSAGAQEGIVQHGITFTKGCLSPTKIGDPFMCSYAIRNISDEAQDTLTINGMVDVVHANLGNVSSGNIMDPLNPLFGVVEFTITTTAQGATPSGATCVAQSGNGIFPTPYKGVTSCTLPFGSRVNILSFSHYTVQPSDFNNPGNALSNDASLTWHDVCNGPSGNCNPDPPPTAASSQTIVQKHPSSTATDIHDAQHQVVLAVAAGSTVHDLATVTGQPGKPTPTGNVTFDWFTNDQCTGTPAAVSGNVPLDGAGQAHATSFPQTVGVGRYAFRAHYAGDAWYLASDGPCEPLKVVAARISIVESATNQVNDPHAFTVTVEKNDGSGWTPAAGVAVTGSATGVGSITTPCGSTNASGQCTITINSALPGQTTVNASATVVVDGVSIMVATNGAGAHTVSNVKTWVDARISIRQSGTNPVNQAHTFTVKVERNDGVNGWQPAAGVAIASTTSFGSITGGTCGAPATGPTNASGECTIIVNSPNVGTANVNASGTVPVGGINIAVATNGYGAFEIGNQKTWVDARITIAQSGTNEIGHPHTFTVFVEKNDGTGWVAAPGVTITSTTNFGTITGGTCGPTGPTGQDGRCTVTVNSNTPGVATVNASGTVSVGGINIAVATNGYGSHNISNQKTWVDANIQIAADGVNRVGSPHTFTGHVNVNAGAGFVNAPNGTQINFAIVSGPGALTPASCMTAGGTGSCSVTLNSNVVGVTIVSASTNVTVAGLPLSRTTNGLAGNSGNATKRWVDARISIGTTGTNQITQAHTFTVTVESNNGSGWVPAAGATVTPTTNFGTITGGTCNAPTNAQGQCTIVVNSSSPGTATVNASATVTVQGLAIQVATNGSGAFNVSNQKTWVDAFITINPPTATNPVNTTHVFTAAVQVNPGTGFVAAPNGTQVSFTLLAGSVGSFVGASTCTTTGGQCSVTITSPNAGTSTMQASTTVTVGGVSMTRTTGTASPGAANSGNAVKNWQTPSNPAIQITKSPDDQLIPKGTSANWTIVVTNTGNVTLTNVTVTDAQAPGCNRTSAQIAALASMAPGASVTYTCSRANVQAGFTNVAVTVGTPPTGPNVTDDDDAVVRVREPLQPPTPQTEPAIDIVKNPDIQTVAMGETATFRITVTNTGEETLRNVTVTDPKAPNCNRRFPGTMAPGASRTYTCTRPNVLAGFRNVARVVGTAPDGEKVRDADDAFVRVPLQPPPVPAIRIVKDPNSQTVPMGGTANWKITVTNTGETPLVMVTVTDPKAQNCNRKLGKLAIGQSKSYTCKRGGVRKSFVNVAKVVGTSPAGQKVTDSDPAAVTTSIPDFTG